MIVSDDPYDFRDSVNPTATNAVRDHVKNDADVDYNQAGLSSIVRELIAVDDGTVISTETLTISAVVYNTLQAWPPDGAQPDNEGFNFLDRYAVPRAYSGRQVEYRATFTDTSNRVTILRGLINVRAMP